MNLRVEREELEHEMLFDFATFADSTLGRKNIEEKCNLRTEFQRDRDRIIHSKSFRRLKHKTQVFISPEGDHFRTRLTHTLEVSQIARTIARSLRLNEDLVEAIALGHDLGHTPFGHSGETVLNELKESGFIHSEQSLKVVDFLERSDKRIGLNLTEEVRDGILNHSGDGNAKTLEGKIIKFADRIAYINHDIDDAIRAGIISSDSLPKELTKVLGNTSSERINTMINALVTKSYGKPIVEMEEEVYEATMELRKYMFKKVYMDPVVKSEEIKIKGLLGELYKYYEEDLNRIPKNHLDLYDSRVHSDEDIVADYIAGMTDTYAMNQLKNIFIPKGWSI
ncbi:MULTISPECIES: deoxyguanosinetriphosphate triphosphohydrolase [Peptoniphilus]|uniref:deoxyguanosinetriphosphate triphosphohydrolase n=1 Tax=Peptoniphilus TaxID=162289 RepID=UPI0023560434|nr:MULTISPECIES: deoxyguanosinetriphosphate triphosphohydrolase [Peptoniphilus]MBS6611022.1 deoxyguanosinetriphosphate triphosphohydrolase [Peptoniphilus harei]MDU5377975.1 deoxyguanosinetriphosphate triphosphohydrolase [Peptoniphilus lacydonensis]MDU5436757.1 deoxyguanosinetriphosphate triphosphohydrolase [Peptoniphilus lacydonensis]